MNYKRMWLSLKKIIDEEEDILYEASNKAKTGNLADELAAQAEEVDYIAGEIKMLEARELLLQVKKECEAENESH